MITLKRRTKRTFLAVAAIPVVSTFLAFWSRSEFQRRVDWVRHTEEVLAEINVASSLVTDAETGQRGYLLTGDPEYLKPYEAALSQIGPQLAKIRAVMADNPSQQSLATEFEREAEVKLAELKRTVEIRRTSGLAEVMTVISSNQGLHSMEAIQAVAKKMRLTENSLLQERLKDQWSTGRWVTGLFAFSIAITTALLLWAERLITRYASNAARSQEEVRQLNSQLEQRIEARTAQLQRSNEDLERFAYVASHDLQEPLRLVGSYVGLLAHRYRGKLDTDADSFIQFAVDGSKRMQNMIDDLLAYSRAGTQALNTSIVDMNSVLTQAVGNVQVAIEESDAEITWDAMPPIQADEIKLVQVFQNLFSNSIKFRNTDKPPRVHVASRKDGENWIITVQDNGIGFDPKYSDRIFMLFQRLHSVGKYPGTGLGLAIMKRIIELHGGTVSVDSTPGEGSTFYLTLPAASDQALARLAVRSASGTAAG